MNDAFFWDMARQATDEIRWLMANSEGVPGLRLDGTVMPWAEVIDLYLPSWRR